MESYKAGRSLLTQEGMASTIASCAQTCRHTSAHRVDNWHLQASEVCGATYCDVLSVAAVRSIVRPRCDDCERLSSWQGWMFSEVLRSPTQENPRENVSFKKQNCLVTLVTCGIFRLPTLFRLWKKAMARRLPQVAALSLGGLTTRWSVELHRSLVHRLMRSPRLITKPFSLGSPVGDGMAIVIYCNYVFIYIDKKNICMYTVYIIYVHKYCVHITIYHILQMFTPVCLSPHRKPQFQAWLSFRANHMLTHGFASPKQFRPEVFTETLVAVLIMATLEAHY